MAVSMDIDGTTIRVPRGDTGEITFDVENENLEAGTIRFTVKAKPEEDYPALIEKDITLGAEDTEITIQLATEDTNRTPGVYWWDLKYIKDGTVDTLTKPMMFRILRTAGSVVTGEGSVVTGE